VDEGNTHERTEGKVANCMCFCKQPPKTNRN